MMRGLTTPVAIFAMTALVAGCMSDELGPTDGLTLGAGDAIAANSVMQMVDPWQRGVEETRLRVPAARPEKPGSADEAAAAKDYQTNDD